MSAAEARVRRLLGADAALYREIRLEALTQSPEAFGSTFEAEGVRPLAWFADRLDGAAVFGAFDGAELLGIAGLYIQQGRKHAHKGTLWTMYVRPSARRAGIGRRLVEAVIEHARRHVELVQLSVVSSNEPARRLYASLGFVEYGIEKDALKADGQYWDEVLMAKPLSGRAGGR
ncbi:MAG TPA: GNAT family N-acetyltransferase [Stellaceae bacterium]|nr:GNAT family N-acetyltransferase [Stellaceae bacterium]